MFRKVSLSIFLFLIVLGNSLKAQNTSIFSKKVYFHYIHVNLNTSAKQILDEIATNLVQNPNLQIKIKGHSCNLPSEEDALIISKQRTNKVKDYLILKGVDEKQLIAQDFGLQNPTLSNDNEYGRIKNRRVEFEIVKN